MGLIKFFQWIIIHEVHTKKIDIAHMTPGSFLAESRLFEPGSKIVKDGLVVGANGLYLGIVCSGVTHDTYLNLWFLTFKDCWQFLPFSSPVLQRAMRKY